MGELLSNFFLCFLLWRKHPIFQPKMKPREQRERIAVDLGVKSEKFIIIIFFIFFFFLKRINNYCGIYIILIFFSAETFSVRLTQCFRDA